MPSPCSRYLSGPSYTPLYGSVQEEILMIQTIIWSVLMDIFCIPSEVIPGIHLITFRWWPGKTGQKTYTKRSRLRRRLRLSDKSDISVVGSSGYWFVSSSVELVWGFSSRGSGWNQLVITYRSHSFSQVPLSFTVEEEGNSFANMGEIDLWDNLNFHDPSSPLSKEAKRVRKKQKNILKTFSHLKCANLRNVSVFITY